MKGSEFKALALKTEKTPLFVKVTGDPTKDRMLARMMHALLGMMSEVGEVADQLKKHIIYGKELDVINLIEEHGDESWYLSLLIDACGSTWEQSWERNIAKLRARYGGEFSEEKALNRDLDVERAALENANSLTLTRHQTDILIEALKALDVIRVPYEENIALRQTLRTYRDSLP